MGGGGREWVEGGGGGRCGVRGSVEGGGRSGGVEDSWWML